MNVLYDNICIKINNIYFSVLIFILVFGKVGDWVIDVGESIVDILFKMIKGFCYWGVLVVCEFDDLKRLDFYVIYFLFGVFFDVNNFI